MAELHEQLEKMKSLSLDDRTSKCSNPCNLPSFARASELSSENSFVPAGVDEETSRTQNQLPEENCSNINEQIENLKWQKLCHQNELLLIEEKLLALQAQKQPDGSNSIVTLGCQEQQLPSINQSVKKKKPPKFPNAAKNSANFRKRLLQYSKNEEKEGGRFKKNNDCPDSWDGSIFRKEMFGETSQICDPITGWPDQWGPQMPCSSNSNTAPWDFGSALADSQILETSQTNYSVTAVSDSWSRPSQSQFSSTFNTSITDYWYDPWDSWPQCSSTLNTTSSLSADFATKQENTLPASFDGTEHSSSPSLSQGAKRGRPITQHNDRAKRQRESQKRLYMLRKQKKDEWERMNNARNPR